MASELMYQFFKFLYATEQDRYKELVKRGQLYLSLVTLYLGILAVKATEPIESFDGGWFLKLCYLSALVSLLLSLVLVILALGIYKYEVPSYPKRIIESFGQKPPTDDGFRDDRIIDFSVATERNSLRNEERAKLLRYSSAFLLTGALLHVIFFIITGLK